MIGDKLKEFSKIAISKGIEPSVIHTSYIYNLQTEEDYDEILRYLDENPKASAKDLHMQVHRIHLRKKGINI